MFGSSRIIIFLLFSSVFSSWVRCTELFQQMYDIEQGLSLSVGMQLPDELKGQLSLSEDRISSQLELRLREFGFSLKPYNDIEPASDTLVYLSVNIVPINYSYCYTMALRVYQPTIRGNVLDLIKSRMLPVPTNDVLAASPEGITRSRNSRLFSYLLVAANCRLSMVYEDTSLHTSSKERIVDVVKSDALEKLDILINTILTLRERLEESRARTDEYIKHNKDATSDAQKPQGNNYEKQD